MSDNFITTIAARTIGEIPTVESLTHPIYLPLPAMPGDYSEDASWEPEPSASMDDEPDLSFMPLVTSEGWSITMPRWDETQELGIVETWDENPVQELDSEVNPRVESLQDVGKVWEATQSVEEGGRQEDRESGEDGDTHQVNRLEVAPQSVEANVEFDLPGSTSEHGFTQVPDDTQPTVNRQFTNLENGETHTSPEMERRNTSSNQPVANSSNLTKETETSPIPIAPQVNRLEVAPQSVEANVGFNLPASTSESGFTQVPDDTQPTVNRQFANLENGETHTSPEMERRNTSSNQPVVNSSNLTRETETSPISIAPQVNRLEVAPQSVEANVEFDVPGSTSESGVTQVPDDTQLTLNRQFTNPENGETTTSTNQQRGNSNQQPVVSPSNVTKETETPAKIAPQVNRLEVPPQSVEANVEFTSPTSNSESELHQALNNTHKPLHRQLTNTEDPPVQSNDKIRGLNVDGVQNINASKTSRQEVVHPASNHLKPQSVKVNVEFTSLVSTSESELHPVPNNTQSSPPRKLIDPRKQQTQKHGDVNRRKITKETITSNLVNGSQVKNQVKPTLKERTFAPQVNRVETVKPSVKSDIELDPTQLHLQSPLQPEVTNRKNIPEKLNSPIVQSSASDNTQFSKQSQLRHGEANRSKLTEQKVNLQKMVKVGTNNSVISPRQQSVEPNLHLNSTLVKGDSRKASSPEHPKTESIQHITSINTEKTENFADRRINQTPVSRARINSPRHESVIPLKDDSENLLSAPKVKSSSLADNQPQPRRHQLESPSSPTIQVTIGRIEVRGVQPAASPKAKAKQSQKRSPAMTLSDYLKQRNAK